jgi:hypothetical protein
MLMAPTASKTIPISDPVMIGTGVQEPRTSFGWCRANPVIFESLLAMMSTRSGALKASVT